MNSGKPITFTRLAAGRYRVSGIPVRRSPGVLEVTFRYPTGFLRPFFRHARQPGPKEPYTFPRFEFAPKPPGQRVGPWPGWRGIPELPTVLLEGRCLTTIGRFCFLGDEEARRHLRAAFTTDGISSKGPVLSIDDPRLKPIAGRFFSGGIRRAPDHPVQLLKSLSGRHPRLLFDPDAIPSIRDQAHLGHKLHFNRLVDLMKAEDLPFEISSESKALPGPERLSPEDRLLIRTLLALIDPGDRRIRAARKTLRGYLTMASAGDYPPMGIDTQSGESLFTACLAYDWLHGALSSRDRAAVRRALHKMATTCRNHLGPDRRDYAQAHYLGCGLGLLAYGFLMWEIDPDAPRLISELRGAFDHVLRMLPRDGSYPHGINLWVYEYGFILRWLEVIRQCTGEDLWLTTPHFAKTSHFRAAATSADGLHGVTFGDPQYRIAGDSWCHSLIAARTGSPIAQALGNRLIDSRPAGIDHRHIAPRRRVYEYLWHEPRLPARELPDGLHHFRDVGQIFVRQDDRLITIRCGAPIGMKRRSIGEWGGYGHTDPCQGAFLVWQGDAFVASGPGPVYRRETSMHNAVTVNGRGQVGDSCVWAPDFLSPEFVPKGPKVNSDRGEISICMDLTPTYLPHLGVVRHVRILHLDAALNISGRDEIKLNQPGRIRWHFHSWCPVKLRTTRDKPVFDIGSVCRVTFRRRKGTLASSHRETFVPAYPNDGLRGTVVSVCCSAATTTFNWRLNWFS